jgi:hypothetical protein
LHQYATQNRAKCWANESYALEEAHEPAPLPGGRNVTHGARASADSGRTAGRLDCAHDHEKPVFGVGCECDADARSHVYNETQDKDRPSAKRI